MKFSYCKSCGRAFWPRPQVPNQTYCSAPECQRERRRRWQQEKRRIDPDYRDNDARYNKDWAAENPDYWKNYRENHPNYADRNRSQQQIRNQRQQGERIAKVDMSPPISLLPAGRYRLTPVNTDGIAKGDSWIVEITVVSIACDDSDA